MVNFFDPNTGSFRISPGDGSIQFSMPIYRSTKMKYPTGTEEDQIDFAMRLKLLVPDSPARPPDQKDGSLILPGFVDWRRFKQLISADEVDRANDQTDVSSREGNTSSALCIRSPISATRQMDAKNTKDFFEILMPETKAHAEQGSKSLRGYLRRRCRELGEGAEVMDDTIELLSTLNMEHMFSDAPSAVGQLFSSASELQARSEERGGKIRMLANRLHRSLLFLSSQIQPTSPNRREMIQETRRLLQRLSDLQEYAYSKPEELMDPGEDMSTLFRTIAEETAPFYQRDPRTTAEGQAVKSAHQAHPTDSNTIKDNGNQSGSTSLVDVLGSVMNLASWWL